MATDTRIAKTQPLSKQLAALDPTNPDSVVTVATQLQKFIKENKLCSNVGGKEYINVEGWQFLFACANLTPDFDEPKRITDRTDTEIAYSAMVRMRDANGNVASSGYATCSNKENGKKFYAEYAIASMAQTRAVGKAGRNRFSFIVKAAGFEGTPLEEMDYQTVPGEHVDKPIEPPRPTVAGNVPAGPDSAPPAASTSSDQSLPVSEFESATAATVEAAETASIEALAVGRDVRYASTQQKEEIIRLLNNPVITRAEKTKMLLNINKLDEQRAQQSIDKLKLVIQERETEQQLAA